MDLTEHEWEVLEMLAGKRYLDWGAWVGACLEFLSEMGLASEMPYTITEAGKKALEQRGAL